jgi:hypothetical protein
MDLVDAVLLCANKAISSGLNIGSQYLVKLIPFFCPIAQPTLCHERYYFFLRLPRIARRNRWTGRGASHLSSLVHRLDRLDGKKQEIIQRAGALTRGPDDTMRANVVMINRDVGIDRIATYALDSFHKAT